MWIKEARMNFSNRGGISRTLRWLFLYCLLWPLKRPGHPGAETGGKENEGRNAKDQDVPPGLLSAGSIGQCHGVGQCHDAAIDVVQVIKTCASPQIPATNLAASARNRLK